MPNPAFETIDPPYMTFRFEVVLDIPSPPSGVTNPVCNAAFQECNGLEMTMEPKAIREGGNNLEHQHRLGPVSYGQLTLRRGITSNLQLWAWFLAAVTPGNDYSANGQITLWDADGSPRLTFVVKECLPVKMSGPSFNAKDGQVAIEEMQLAYKSLEVRPAGAGSGGLGFGGSASVGFGASASFSAGASASFGASLAASASASVSGSLSVSGGAGLSGNAGFGG
jgi:phage tail-like protein